MMVLKGHMTMKIQLQESALEGVYKYIQKMSKERQYAMNVTQGVHELLARGIASALTEGPLTAPAQHSASIVTALQGAIPSDASTVTTPRLPGTLQERMAAWKRGAGTST